MSEFITDNRNKYSIMLCYTHLDIEDALLWIQTFNSTSVDTGSKTNIQNGQENNAEISNRNQEVRP